MMTNNVSVCDGCSNWRICKFNEEIKRAEKQFMLTQEHASWPECVKTMLNCKYKQYVANRLNYNDFDITKTNTGNPPFIYNEGATCNTVK